MNCKQISAIYCAIVHLPLFTVYSSNWIRCKNTMNSATNHKIINFGQYWIAILEHELHVNTKYHTPYPWPPAEQNSMYCEPFSFLYYNKRVMTPVLKSVIFLYSNTQNVHEKQVWIKREMHADVKTPFVTFRSRVTLILNRAKKIVSKNFAVVSHYM
jgi:hypothetical protein